MNNALSPGLSPDIYPLETPTNCVALYNFQDNTSKIIDHSGRKNDVTHNGAWTPYGLSVATNQFIDCGNTFNPAGTYSVHIVMYIDPAIALNADVLSKYDGTTTGFLLFYTNVDTTLSFYSGGLAGGNRAYFATSKGKWIDVVCVYDGTTQIYVNSVKGTNATTSLAAGVATTNLFAGKRYNNSNYLNGKIAYLALYDAALTPAEVRRNYENIKAYTQKRDIKL